MTIGPRVQLAPRRKPVGHILAELGAINFLMVLASGCATQPMKSVVAPLPTTARRLSAAQEIKISQLQSPERRAEIVSEIDQLIDEEKRAPAAEPTPLKTAPPEPVAQIKPAPPPKLMHLNTWDESNVRLSEQGDTQFIFDIPVTYNDRVKRWIKYYQTSGARSFRTWLERSSRFAPMLKGSLVRAGLPQDLVYLAMVESGFNTDASSEKSALGLWQFIEPTARRYGLQMSWWIDERRDYARSTTAAISYMNDLYRQFQSWYLVAASYNMGESAVRRLINRYHTNNFWELARRGALPQETTDYVPKIIAAMLIAKAPALYGFRDLNFLAPIDFDYFNAPGGTDLINLANYLGISEKYLKELNPELIKGFIPRDVHGYHIRVPKGSLVSVAQFVQMQSMD